MIEVIVLLVSEQPMPNYLALLEFKPRYIYMLRTEDTGLRLVAKNLVSSITQRFLQVYPLDRKWCSPMI